VIAREDKVVSRIPGLRSPWRTIVLAVLVSVAFLAGVVASPLAMKWLTGTRLKWAELSDVGQAYGGVSAVLSGLAFCGVAASLLMQRRQARLAQIYSIRQRHFELVKLALDDPQYLFVDGPNEADDPNARLKVYANLLVGHWAMMWDLDAITADLVRAGAARLFATALARQWWTEWGASFLSSKHRVRFVDLMTSECDRATRLAPAARPAVPLPNPPVAPAQTTAADAPHAARWFPPSPLLWLGMAAGVVTYHVLRRRSPRGK
jgi:hypothetical protein